MDEYNYVFVLGYDLLQDYLKKENMACDEAFEFCVNVYRDFLKSEYNDINKPEYDCLQEYVRNNQTFI